MKAKKRTKQEVHHLDVMDTAITYLVILSALLEAGHEIDAQAVAKELYELADDLFDLTFPDAG